MSDVQKTIELKKTWEEWKILTLLMFYSLHSNVIKVCILHNSIVYTPVWLKTILICFLYINLYLLVLKEYHKIDEHKFSF